MSSPSETANESPNVHALIVDDTADIRFMVGFQLKMEGLSFDQASSGEEALQKCAATDFDLVVLDYRMPGISGLDVANELRRNGYPAQIVIYSAYADQELQAAARKLDVPVVDKADNERLLQVVRSAVGLVPA